jgi:predicted permease
MRWPWRRHEDLDDEIASHLAMAEHDQRADGKSAREAETAARREFGSVALVKEVTRDMWGWSWVDRFAQDLRYAGRVLTKRPVSSLAAITTMALAIGANVAVFSLVDRLVLHPLNVPDANRLVTPQSSMMMRGVESRFSTVLYEDYLKLRTARSTVEEWAAFGRPPGTVAISFAPDEPAARLWPLFVSDNYSHVLGTPLLLGRFFGDADAAPDGPLSAILTERSWRVRFAAHRGVVGRMITVEGQQALIVGVAPDEAADTVFGAARVDILFPLAAAARIGGPMNYFGPLGSVVNGASPVSWLTLLGRLKTQATLNQAQAEVQSVLADSRRSRTIYLARFVDAFIPLSQRPDVVRFTALLAGAVGLTLLIGCANLSGLLLARIEERRPELAVRAALGASRGRVAQQLAVEAGVLALAGGAAALLVARWVEAAFAAFSLPGGIAVSSLRSGFEARTLFFAFAVTLVAISICSVVPIVRGSRRDLQPDLRRRSGRSGRYGAARVLLGVQVAVCVVLLFGATLFVRSLSSALSTDMGFDGRNLIVARLDPGIARYNAARAAQYVSDLVERIQKTPGVDVVTSGPPPLFGGTASTPTVQIDGVSQKLQENVAVSVIDDRYMAVIRQPIVAGRDFGPQDRAGSPLVALVNESAARRLWAGASPIDRRVGLYPPFLGEMEVIGVVRDAKYASLRESGRAGIYVLRTQHAAGGGRPTTLVIRASAGPRTVIPTLHRIADELDPQLPLADVQTIDDRLGVLVMPQRLGRWLLTALGVIALLLTLVGVYGLVAGIVASSSREIGIRIALGASPDAVVRAFVNRSMLPVAVGLGAGVPAALFAGRFADRFLYGVEGSDPATAMMAIVLVVTATGIAALIPARRALKINPVEALRAE